MKKYALLILIVLVCAVLVSSCAKAPEMSQESLDNLKKHGDLFAVDLKKRIVPNMENPELIVDEGCIVSVKEGAEGLELLRRFGEAYGAHNDCDVTMVFSDKAFVVVRVVVSDGEGYYFRYQYDPKNPQDYTISGQLVGDIDVTRQNNPSGWTMALRDGKKEIATFSFKMKE